MWFSVHTSWWVAFIVYNIAVSKWEKWNKRLFSSFPDWLVWQRAVWGIDVINLGFFVVLLGILLSRILILYSMHWVKYTCFSFNKLVSSLSAYTIFNWWFKWKIIMQRQLLLCHDCFYYIFSKNCSLQISLLTLEWHIHPKSYIWKPHLNNSCQMQELSFTEVKWRASDFSQLKGISAMQHLHRGWVVFFCYYTLNKNQNQVPPQSFKC